MLIRGAGDGKPMHRILLCVLQADSAVPCLFCRPSMAISATFVDLPGLENQPELAAEQNYSDRIDQSAIQLGGGWGQAKLNNIFLKIQNEKNMN